MDLSNIIYLYQSKLISKFEIFSNLLRGKKVEERHYEKGACIICEWNQKIKKKKKIGRHKPQSIVYLEKITLSIGNLLKNFLTKMSKGRLKKCHLPTIMSLSISYYNIEMVLFMLHALLLLFFFFFGFQMKWENKTYECVRLLRPPASHVDPSDMEAKHRYRDWIFWVSSWGSISTKFVLLISQIWMHENFQSFPMSAPIGHVK